MPEKRTRLEDLPPRERAAWSRYFELLAIGAQRKAEAAAKAKQEEATA